MRTNLIVFVLLLCFAPAIYAGSHGGSSFSGGGQRASAPAPRQESRSSARPAGTFGFSRSFGGPKKATAPKATTKTTTSSPASTTTVTKTSSSTVNISTTNINYHGGYYYGPGYYYWPGVYYPILGFGFGFGYQFGYEPYATASGIKFNLDEIAKDDRKAIEDAGVYLPVSEDDTKPGYLGSVGNFSGKFHRALPLKPGTYDLTVAVKDGRKFELNVTVQPGRVTNVKLSFDQKEESEAPKFVPAEKQ